MRVFYKLAQIISVKVLLYAAFKVDCIAKQSKPEF